MGAVVGVGRDQLIGLHVDADAQDALVLVRRLAERIAVGPGGDADARHALDRKCGRRCRGKNGCGEQARAATDHMASHCFPTPCRPLEAPAHPKHSIVIVERVV